MMVDPLANLLSGRLGGKVGDGAIDPIRPRQAIVVCRAGLLELVVVIDEVIDAELPEDEVGFDLIKIPIQDQVFLKRPVPTDSIRKYFHFHQSAQKGRIRLSI